MRDVLVIQSAEVRNQTSLCHSLQPKCSNVAILNTEIKKLPVFQPVAFSAP